MTPPLSPVLRRAFVLSLVGSSGCVSPPPPEPRGSTDVWTDQVHVSSLDRVDLLFVKIGRAHV